MSAVYVVVGAPCSGKTTFVGKHRSGDDIVLDLDALQIALGLRCKDWHDSVDGSEDPNANDVGIVQASSDC